MHHSMNILARPKQTTTLEITPPPSIPVLRSGRSLTGADGWIENGNLRGIRGIGRRRAGVGPTPRVGPRDEIIASSYQLSWNLEKH